MKGTIIRREWGEIMITYRKAVPEDIHPALDLVLRVFIEFDAPYYEQEAVIHFKEDIKQILANATYARDIQQGKYLLLLALDGDRIVGVIGNRAKGDEIGTLFVDGEYHRQGVATELMNRMVCELKLRRFDRITVDASPYGFPFYEKFGFSPTDTEKKLNGFIYTPMAYVPNEIWDILDEHGKKTGRYAERGRKMATGDYHLVVHVWKRNSRGEWLIDKRAPTRGTSIDGKWETTGGSAVAGDDSLIAAVRETKEELGIDLDPQKGTLFSTIARHGNDGHSWLQDAWVFEHDCSIEDVRFQEGETCDAMWATADKIREMMATGEFLSEWFYPYFDEMVEKWRIPQ